MVIQSVHIRHILYKIFVCSSLLFMKLYMQGSDDARKVFIRMVFFVIFFFFVILFLILLDFVNIVSLVDQVPYFLRKLMGCLVEAAMSCLSKGSVSR